MSDSYTSENYETYEVSETVESTGSAENVSECYDEPENYDDCGTKVQESSDDVAEKTEVREETEAYDDCGSNEVTEGTEEETEETAEDSEYDDCRPDAETKEVPEEVEEKPEETEEEVEEKPEEATEEVEEKPEETTEEVEEKPEEAPEDIKEETTEETSEKIDEKTEEAAEEASEEAAEEVKEETSKETAEETSEEVEEKTEEAAEEASEEAAEEVKEETAEETAEETSEEIEEKTEEAAEEASEEAAEEVKEETAEETAEETSEEIEEKTEEAAEEAKEETSEEVEEKSEEAAKEVSEEIEEETEETSETKEVLENAEKKPEKQELAELSDKRDEHAGELSAAREENEKLKKEASDRFSDVLNKDRGTEDYKESLQEYNDTRAKLEESESLVKEMEKEQGELEKKTVELREAQLEKGRQAAAEAEATLAASKALDEQFKEAAFSGDEALLTGIQEENTALLGTVTSERDSVRLAMDAKMSEIRDYVCENNFDQHDTYYDPHYQELIREYNDLQEVHHRLDYQAVKLDENNREIAERTGKDYESVLTKKGLMVREVADGTDVPGETDYFKDTGRVSEVLTPFRQENWENLSLTEQKRAVMDLAELNADTLGVSERPAIAFYRSDNPDDYGGYSATQHTIFINENNMTDAAETADTVSHEYRHCYQHERAEKLENERDLAFKEGFDDYIDPENDYRGYRDQLVEADARAYADVVKQKITEISENPESRNASSLENTAGMPGEVSEKSPEKGAVFKEVEKEDLPEDFSQKVREVKDFHEVFEVRETEEIKAQVAPHYENGRKVAQRVKDFDSYKEHNSLEGGHIEKVHQKSLEAADVLEESFRKNDYDGLYSPEIDRKSLEMMAWYHDTGMDGNVDFKDYDAERNAWKDNPENREAYIEKQVKKNGLSEEEALQKFEKQGFEEHIRPDHSLQSAIHVLRDREFVESHGVDAEKVALGCFLHSKSCSEVGNLADEAQYETAIHRLNDGIDAFNQAHPEEKIGNVSCGFLKNEDGTFRKEALAELRSESLCLRIGDANGHGCESRISQNGKEIGFRLEAWESEEIPEELETKILKAKYDKFLDEARLAHVTVDGDELTDETDPAGFGRMYAVGEGNFRDLRMESDGGMPVQKFELVNGDAYPLCTQNCILERVKELNTAKLDRDMRIERSAWMNDKQFAEYKKEQLDTMQKVDCRVEIHIGGADEMTRKSYKAFASDIEDSYNIKVSILP